MNTSSARQARVLVALPNWLGDVVMACPLLELLHRARDEFGQPLQVFACVRRRWAPLLTRDSRLAGLIPYERTGRHAGPLGMLGLAASWRAAACDAAILCPPSLRVGLTAWLARIPLRIGERRDSRRLFLSLHIPPAQACGSMHHSEELMRLGCALLKHNAWDVPDMSGLPPCLPGLDTLAATPPGNGPPVWVLAPGASYGPAKNWPEARLAEFLDLAVNEEGRRVAMVGDTTVAALASRLEKATRHIPWRRELPGPPGVIDLVGSTTVIDLAALLKSAEAFVGNDSGAMHLSAALSVPTLGLFGSTSASWTGPKGARARSLVAGGFPCQPCFRKTCNQSVFCLSALSGEDVLASLRELLGQPDREPRQ